MKNFLVSFLLIVAASQAQQLSAKKSLNLAVTKLIVAAAEKEAAKNGLAMFITVIDDGGTTMMIERMDDAQIAASMSRWGRLRPHLNSNGLPRRLKT